MLPVSMIICYLKLKFKIFDFKKNLNVMYSSSTRSKAAYNLHKKTKTRVSTTVNISTRASATY